ncbi:LacI family DNA-binding transcriptional regulator [Rathayibacter sp. VKM Ac-2805]|uniref:LacI family DNA-binding transcriptional regulator n=1 Tax=Rathayibacter sp. VKM Ac-2805 TaxID=2609258 RepID=UPI00244D6D9A|nr:LacI family DNA-binding transcriptional regulator [Rathayibacter sp. VKM Ac-2805]
MTSTTPARRATSSDVARRAGLSRTTVSQILNGNVASFPQETRDRVSAAAAELNYRPSRAGRALATGVSDMIVLAIPSATFGPNLQNAVDQITEASATLGMSVVVRFAGRDTAATLTSVLDLRPMVIIDFGVFTPEQGRTLESAGSRLFPPIPESGQDATDELDVFVGRLQVRELVLRGKRHVIYAQLQDSRAAPYGDFRLQGVRSECSAHGLADPVVIRVELDEDSATQALSSALETTGDDAVAVCAYNDDVAIAVIAAARRLELPVPSRVGVIGVDHTMLGQLVAPRLTSVHIDLPRIIDLFLGQLTVIRGAGAATADEVTALEPSDVAWVVAGDSC